MMPERPHDTVKRTMYNLRFIEEHSAPQGPYEVTQLVNSFLGALAHPWESLRTDLNSLTLDEAKRRNWPDTRKSKSSDRDPGSLGELIAWTRHAFAHGHVEYYPDDSGNEISRIHFWNEYPPGKRIWGTVLQVPELRAYLNAFVELANGLYEGQAAPEAGTVVD